jgi:vanillate O-demethylase monooxygenase subunit
MERLIAAEQGANAAQARTIAITPVADTSQALA